MWPLRVSASTQSIWITSYKYRKKGIQEGHKKELIVNMFSSIKSLMFGYFRGSKVLQKYIKLDYLNDYLELLVCPSGMVFTQFWIIGGGDCVRTIREFFWKLL